MPSPPACGLGRMWSIPWQPNVWRCIVKPSGAYDVRGSGIGSGAPASWRGDPEPLPQTAPGDSHPRGWALLPTARTGQSGSSATARQIPEPPGFRRGEAQGARLPRPRWARADPASAGVCRHAGRHPSISGDAPIWSRECQPCPGREWRVRWADPPGRPPHAVEGPPAVLNRARGGSLPRVARGHVSCADRGETPRPRPPRDGTPLLRFRGGALAVDSGWGME